MHNHECIQIFKINENIAPADVYSLQKASGKPTLREKRNNMKRSVKTAAALLACAAMIGAMPVNISAKTASSSASSSSAQASGLKNAIAAVKSRIDIPEEFSEFKSSVSTYNGLTSYSLTWSLPSDASKGDYAKRSITAQYTGNTITSYQSPYAASSTRPAFSKLSQQTLENKAIEYANQLIPESKGKLRVQSTSMSLGSGNVSVYLARVNGDAALSKNMITVSLDKMTGRLLGLNATWWEGASFADSTKALSQEKIKAIYKKEASATLQFRLTYKSTDGKESYYTAVPVYSSDSIFTYNALTGEHSTMDKDFAASRNTDLYDEELEVEEDSDDIATAEGAEITSAKAVNFTEAELKQDEDLSKCLTQAQFKALMIKDPYINVTDKYLTTSYDISRDSSYESGYGVTVNYTLNNSDSYSSYYINADAVTGKVRSFNCWGDAASSNEVIDIKAVNATAGKVIAYYVPEISKEYKANIDNTAPAQKTKSYVESERTLRYTRYKFNISVPDDTINVRVNSKGVVTSFNYNYHKNVDFGSGKVISKAKAIDTYLANNDLSLYYDGFLDLRSKPTTYLHYKSANWYVNAYTGQMCNYSGGKLTEKAVAPAECPYTDIGTSPYKDEITRLYSYNVRFTTGEKLDPGAKVTKTELQQLLNGISSGGYVIYDDYDDVYEDYVVYPEEASDNSKVKYLTRLDAAKLFVEKEGYSKAAALQGIYKAPFKNISSTDSDAGYIAIAKLLGVAQGNSKGEYTKNAALTREYALHLIYSYVVNQK